MQRSASAAPGPAAAGPTDDEGLDPTVAEYIRDGISAQGVLRAIELFEDQLAEGATTTVAASVPAFADHRSTW